MDHSQYRGFQIQVDEGGTFRAEVGEDKPYSAERLDTLKEQIDVLLGKRAKTRKLKLPVILDRGETAVITGLHLRSGDGLGLPENARYQNAYPQVDWIVAAIERRQLLFAEVKRIETQIAPYTVKTSYHFGGGRDTTKHVDEYAAALDALETQHAEKLAAAQADTTHD